MWITMRRLFVNKKNSLSTTVLKNSSQNSFFRRTADASIKERVSEFWTSPRAFCTKSTQAQVSEIQSTYLKTIIESQKSLPIIRISEVIPKDMPAEKFFQGAVVGAMFETIKKDVPQVHSMISAMYSVGNPGANSTILQTVGDSKFLTKYVNAIGLFKNIDNISPEVLAKLGKVSVKNPMVISESLTMSILNMYLEIPLKFYQKKAALIDGPEIQNLSGISCPDFLRSFPIPYGSIKKECWDQKFSIAHLMNYNQLRPVSANIGEYTNKAVTLLSEQIKIFDLANPGNIKTHLLLKKLEALQQNYLVNQDVSTYVRCYNQLRDSFGSFFVENRIPMNLVVETGIQNFNINPEFARIYRENFVHMYYNSDSPLVIFANNYINSRQGTKINYDSLIKAFANTFEN